MKKLFWITAVAAVLGGSYIVFHFAVKPRAVLLVKPSFADKGEEIGAILWQRLRQDLRQEPFVVLGFQPEFPAQVSVVLGFLAEAARDQGDFQNLIREYRLNFSTSPEDARWGQVNLTGQWEAFADVVNKAFNEKQRTLLLVPTSFSSHLVHDSPLRLIEEKTKKRLFTISLVRLALATEDLSSLYPRCDSDALFGSGTIASVGCAAKRKSNELLRKKLNRQRFTTVMDMQGEKDYLAYVHTP